MKKNYYLKSIQALLFFCLVFTLTSCEDILGHWEKPTPVTPETPAVATITVAPTATTGDIVAGSTTALVTVATADGGTVMYEVTVTNTKPTSTEGFTATVPTAADLTNSGTYYVWYYVKGDATHSDSEISATGIEVTVVAPVIDLSTLAADYTAKDGETLKGTLSGNYKISIADGATVTLDGLTINGVNDENCKWAGLTALGNATIILKDGSTNTVKGFHKNYPGIYVPEGSTLTIKGETSGTGSLTASPFDGGTASSYGAGIGGGNGISCGNIIIQGGTVNATGGYATGIGSSCGNIDIQGGTVTATSVYCAAIGAAMHGTCDNITISGGTIVALGGSQAAGIGASTAFGQSESSICGDIEITGGDVTATGGKYGAGIGTGVSNDGTIVSKCGNITITSGVTQVKATKGTGSPSSIGKGGANASYNGVCGTVTIGGVVGSVTDSPYKYPWDLYVAGNGSGNWLNGKNWVVDDASNKMTYNEGVYSITYKNVAPSTAPDHYMFKIAKDGNWTVSYGFNPTTTITLGTPTTIAAVDGEGTNIRVELNATSDVTITFDPATMKCTVSATAVN